MFLWISWDFVDLPEFHGSATMRNIKSPELDLDSIIKCWFGLWTKSTCSLFLSVVLLLYFLPFSYHLWLCFSLPLIKITARIDRPQMQRNWQRLRIEIHQSPHIFWPRFDHFGFWEVCCTDYWQQNGIHVTVCLGLNFETCPHLSLKKKDGKTKFCGRLVETVVFSKIVFKSTFDYWIEAEYEYWIVHFMNGLLNQQTKSFSH